MDFTPLEINDIKCVKLHIHRLVTILVPPVILVCLLNSS